MKRLTYILTIVIFISSCNQKSQKSADKIQIVNDEDFIVDSTSIDSHIFTDSGDTIDYEVVFLVADEMPEFGNGWEDIRKYILDNTEYPQTAIDDSIEGRVIVNFVINKDGSVSNPKVIRGLRYDLEEECIRVIENMPDWKPGKARGILVKVSYGIPFIFCLKSESDIKNAITPKNNGNKELIDFKIYPNPASDYTNIEITGYSKDLEYQMVNTKEQIVKSGQIYAATEQINISDIENGLYIIQLFSKEKGLMKTQKLIKNQIKTVGNSKI
jgi:TonB family protein